MALRIFRQKNSNILNLIAIFVGIIAGYAAIGFKYLIGFLQNISFHQKIDFNLSSPLTNSWDWLIIFVPAIGLGLASIIIWRFAKEAKGHGVPEVIESILLHGGRMRKRVVFVKAITSALTIAFGGSVGREGPIVQIGSAAGSTLGQFFKVRQKYLKVLVGCGAAGAISATFNTPIAGVIFAMELIVLEFRATSFIPLTISSVFAAMIARIHMGNEIAFLVPEYSFVHPMELFFYLGLGL